MDKFRSEFMDHLPMARAAFTKGGMSCWEAWAEVWRRTQNRNNKRRHPGEVLGKVLVAFGAFDGATTSGCEQLFSKQERVMPAQRASMSESRIWDEVTLVGDQDPKQEREIVLGAQKEWATAYPKPRTSARGRPRLDESAAHRKRQDHYTYSNAHPHHP